MLAGISLRGCVMVRVAHEKRVVRGTRKGGRGKNWQQTNGESTDESKKRMLMMIMREPFL